MRIRLATRPGVLLGAMVALALVAFLPLRLALAWFGLDDAGLTARRVDGSIWAGRLTEARLGPVALGDLESHLSPWGLLLGRARISFESRGVVAPAAPLHGAVTVSRHGLAADDVTASLATGRLFAPLPVTALDLDAVTVRFRDGACLRAEGRVRATLGGSVAGVPLPATVAGDARCDGAALLLPLASQAGNEGVTLRVTADGAYHADFVVQPGADPAAAARLASFGFVPTATGQRLSVEGRF